MPPSIPDVHSELLFGYEPLAALRAHVLPAVVALVGLLTQVQPAPGYSHWSSLYFCIHKFINHVTVLKAN